MPPLYALALDGDADVFIREAFVPAVLDLFGEDMDDLAEELFAVVFRDAFFQLLYAMDALLLHLIGYLVRIGRRRGAGALGIGENMDAGEADFFQCFQCFLEIFFRFSREADNEIRGQSKPRDLIAQLFDECLVLGEAVMAVHAFQHAVRARLDGEVEMAAHLRLILDDPDQLFGEFDRLDRA